MTADAATVEVDTLKISFGIMDCCYLPDVLAFHTWELWYVRSSALRMNQDQSNSSRLYACFLCAQRITFH